MNILISLFFSITLTFSVFAEEIKIIELHDQTIDQILLNATSDNDDVNNDINNEELRIQFQLLKKKIPSLSLKKVIQVKLSQLFLIFGKMPIKMS